MRHGDTYTHEEYARAVDALTSLNLEAIGLARQLEAYEASPGGRVAKAVSLLRADGPAVVAGKLAGFVARRRRNARASRCNEPNDCVLTRSAPYDGDAPVAVYTCVLGGYDSLKEPLCRPHNVRYFAVTDRDIPPSSAWSRIDPSALDMPEGLGVTKRARYAKTHPHELFPEYEYSVWVDGNFLVVGDLSRELETLGPVVPFSSNWHPQRNCVYREAEWCGLMGLDDASLMRSQVESYRSEGMPERFGLFETNMIVRRHNDPRVVALMEAWWGEIERWSRRDQLSLTYVIWRSGYRMEDFGFVCEEIREYPSVRVVNHEKRHGECEGEAGELAGLVREEGLTFRNGRRGGVSSFVAPCGARRFSSNPASAPRPHARNARGGVERTAWQVSAARRAACGRAVCHVD